MNVHSYLLLVRVPVEATVSYKREPTYFPDPGRSFTWVQRTCKKKALVSFTHLLRDRTWLLAAHSPQSQLVQQRL